MPSPLTSSFASAAANSNGENAGSRRDNTGGNEWSRNRANGATQTFRRTSTNVSLTRDGPPSGGAGSGVYIPPHLNANYQAGGMRNGNPLESRYNKDQLLDIFQSQKENGMLSKHLSEIFTGSWHPINPNRNSTSASWNSRGEGKELASGPEVCWDYEAGGEPLGLVEMVEEEKQLFTASVNSPLKMPQTNAKENAGGGTIGGRKASLSSHAGASGNAANTIGRPGARRRDTSDSFSANGPLSPTGNRQSFFRDEPSASTPPAALLRRRTDFKDDNPQVQDGVKDGENNLRDPAGDVDAAFASLKRSTTGPLSTGLNGPSSSPWSAGPQGSAFGNMGSFGSFAVGSSPLTQDSGEKRPGFGSARGGSRFKDLLSKASAEEMSPSVKQKMSLGNLEKLAEDETETRAANSAEFSQTRRDRSETNPYEDAPLPRSGSAALGGSQELNHANQGIEHLGFSAFGLPPNIGARDFMQRDAGPNPAYQQTPQGRYNSQEPMSPTNTNPYQSPSGNFGDDDDTETNDSESQPSFRRNMASAPDRNQTSGPSSNRGLTTLGGLGGLPPIGGASAWSAGGIASGTPGRDRNPVSSVFGDPVFSPMSDLQSPNLGMLGGGNFFGSGGLNPSASIGRSSKLGAMFPPAMQEQMRGETGRAGGHGNAFGFEAQHEGFPPNTRDPFDGSTRRRDESAFMSEDVSTPFSPQGPFGQSTSNGPSLTPITAPAPVQRMSVISDNAGASAHGLSQSSGSSESHQMPATQQRTMVMPDRMRWIYRDPQGTVQGPWSGLEMHDWFKAGFFTAELQVKKLEDAEYEPLAQLVRRIGNSREPFLVPQIGVPHGSAGANSQVNNWASPTVPGAAPAPPVSTAQPPFASSFPSFGTTLTAEQQNALERRKQEEQFLMARQKEHLAQQQVMMKQMQLQNGPHAMHSLQHHSSAHSLQSQPSFGSITSPSAYQPSPLQGPLQPPQNMPSFLDSVMRHPPPTSNMHQFPSGEPRGSRDDELHNLVDRMSFNQRVMQQPENVSSMLHDRARLQSEQQQSDMRNHRDAFLGQGGQNERLSEFQALRGPPTEYSQIHDIDEMQPQRPIGAPPQRGVDEQTSRQAKHGAPGPIGPPGNFLSFDIPEAMEEELSLTQQVQRAAASHQKAPVPTAESAWHKIDPTDSGPAPPPLSISPLPAPAAQRNRQHVADALAAESRSASQTPIETPSTSVAPWAERSIEIAKGPSLKEIQEAEARKAAEQEEIAASARRAQMEHERLIQPPPPAPGLPATSIWGNLISPATPTGPTASVWAKTSTGKPAAPTTNGSTKKTLAQIQKEEEARKQRAAAAVAAGTVQNTSSMAPSAAGKRYAELASKIATTAVAAPTGAWTTVGQGGKAKAPATVIATPQAAIRTASGNAPAVKARPALQTSRSTASTNQSKAVDEFIKWTKATLGNGLNKSINVEDFVQALLALPPEIEIISDSVYANSDTLDGRRFAEEFIRRRKLADKGMVDSANSATPQGASTDHKSSGGWSEVAKKGPAPKEESNAAFKVVSKKKGRK